MGEQQVVGARQIPTPRRTGAGTLVRIVTDEPATVDLRQPDAGEAVVRPMSAPRRSRAERDR